MTMKMMRSTSITSTMGVTLMSEVTPPRPTPATDGIDEPPNAAEGSSGLPRAPPSGCDRRRD
jgi:hypothetical protein